MKPYSLAASFLLLAAPAFAQELPSYNAPDDVVRLLAAEFAMAMLQDLKKLDPCPFQNGQVSIQRGRVVCEVTYPQRWIGKRERGWTFKPRPEGPFASLILGRESFLVDKERRGDAKTLGQLMERGALIADRDAQRANELVRARAGGEAIGRMLAVPSVDKIFPR